MVRQTNRNLINTIIKAVTAALIVGSEYIGTESLNKDIRINIFLGQTVKIHINLRGHSLQSIIHATNIQSVFCAIRK